MKNPTDFDRAELVRLARMRRCHQDDRPTEREVATALTMLGVARRSHRDQRFTRTFVVAVAVSLSTLGALATTQKLGFTSLIAQLHSMGSASATPRRSARPPLTRLGGERPARLPPAALPAAPGTMSEPDRPAPLRVPSGSREPEAAPRGAGTAAEAWSKAAAALKLGDHAGAQDALNELARSEDAETRAAALLTRAELDLVSGEEERARAVLRSLAERGATPFVRQRARQILAGER